MHSEHVAMFTPNARNVYILWEESEVKEPYAATVSFFFFFFPQISFFPNVMFAGGRNEK